MEESDIGNYDWDSKKGVYKDYLNLEDPMMPNAIGPDGKPIVTNGTAVAAKVATKISNEGEDSEYEDSAKSVESKRQLKKLKKEKKLNKKKQAREEERKKK